MPHPSREEIVATFHRETNTDTPYAVRLDSGTPGPRLLVAGAVHGDEPVGAEYIFRLLHALRDGNTALRRGSVTLLLANPTAFLRNTRFVDANLNRIFASDTVTHDGYEYARAREIAALIAREKFDYLADLHSVSRGDFRIAIGNAACDTIRTLLPRVALMSRILFYHTTHIAGSLMDAVNANGGVGIAFECGNHNAAGALPFATRQMDTLFHALGLMDVTPSQPPATHTIYETLAPIKTGANFRWLVDAPQTDTPLSRGTAFAHDDANGTQRAPRDCVLFMPSKTVHAADHDAGFLCTVTTDAASPTPRA